MKPSHKAKQRNNVYTRHDIYAYNPTYEWTSYKTNVGMVLSYLTMAFMIFYIALTARDYIMRPPELVAQGDIDLLQVPQEVPFAIPTLGIRIGYTNLTANDPTDRVAALDNANPYVRFRVRHVVMKDQVRVQETELPVQDCIVSSIPSQCPITITNSSQQQQQQQQYTLLGTLYKEDFQFLEIILDKCHDDDVCAPLTEINRLLASGELRIRAQVGIEAQQFDVERFHAMGTGLTVSNRSLEYFGLPDIEVQSDIFLQARTVQKEQRYIGSPPMPETETNVLSYDRRETSYRPRVGTETNLMTFAIRLSDNVKLEEVAYWCPSILDLFGLWGAMASFAASLSLGFVAMAYNRWSFHRHFRNVTQRKRQEAQRLTMSAIEFVRKDNNNNTTTRNRRDIYQSLQAQYDALLVEPDLRLFEAHHFDDEGRVALSAAELKYPSTVFGELRRIAILEHGKKKRAATFLSIWYGRHLVRKGFIKNPQRRFELFASVDDNDTTASNLDTNSSENYDGDLKRTSRQSSFSLLLRRRRKKSDSQSNRNLLEQDLEIGDVNDDGIISNEKKSNENSTSSILDIPSGAPQNQEEDQSAGDDILANSERQEKARKVIDDMDPLHLR